MPLTGTAGKSTAGMPGAATTIGIGILATIRGRDPVTFPSKVPRVAGRMRPARTSRSPCEGARLVVATGTDINGHRSATEQHAKYGFYHRNVMTSKCTALDTLLAFTAEGETSK